MDRGRDPLSQRREDASVVQAFVQNDQGFSPCLVECLGDFFCREGGEKPNLEQGNPRDPLFSPEVLRDHFARAGRLP